MSASWNDVRTGSVAYVARATFEVDSRAVLRDFVDSDGQTVHDERKHAWLDILHRQIASEEPPEAIGGPVSSMPAVVMTAVFLEDNTYYWVPAPLHSSGADQFDEQMMEIFHRAQRLILELLIS